MIIIIVFIYIYNLNYPIRVMPPIQYAFFLAIFAWLFFSLEKHTTKEREKERKKPKENDAMTMVWWTWQSVLLQIRKAPVTTCNIILYIIIVSLAIATCEYTYTSYLSRFQTDSWLVNAIWTRKMRCAAAQLTQFDAAHLPMFLSRDICFSCCCCYRTFSTPPPP